MRKRIVIGVVLTLVAAKLATAQLPYPWVTPSALTFSATVGGVPPPPETLDVTSGNSKFPVSTSQPWLTATPMNSATPAQVQVAAASPPEPIAAWSASRSAAWH